MNEKISIIIPIYNVEKYLKKCLDSVISQTYKNLEIILVDDGSPDKCGKICDEYQEIDNRIIVLHNKNIGLSGARNSGLKIATGKYVTFIDSDSDDYIADDYIEVLYKILKEKNADISICNYKSFKNDLNKITNKRIYLKELNSQQAIDRSHKIINPINFITD